VWIYQFKGKTTSGVPMSVYVNGREWYVVDVVKGKPLWVTEATKEELKEIARGGGMI